MVAVNKPFFLRRDKTPAMDCGTTTELSAATEEFRLLNYHLSLLRMETSQHQPHELVTTPIFTMPVLKHIEAILGPDIPRPFPQYGLLAGMGNVRCNEPSSSNSSLPSDIGDPRVFFNATAPSSTFICGSQGFGKSHTLSCLLENCLLASDANKLPKPLTGLVFHYDTFISDHGGSPCEAAFLASNPGIKVRVLCSPSNIRTIKASHALHTGPIKLC